MLNFLFVIIIFFEIFLTIILTAKIIKVEKNIVSFNCSIVKISVMLLEVCEQPKKIVAKSVKIIRLLTNKQLVKTGKIIKILINLIQIITFIKVLKNVKNKKILNFANLRKIFYIHTIFKILEKFMQLNNRFSEF